MTWLEVSVRVSRASAPVVERLLQDWPVLAVTLTDQADDPVLEPGVGETPLWPSVCVTALFEADATLEPLARLLSLVPGIDRPEQVSFSRVEDRQWERAWMDRFEAMPFGSDLWIVPGEMQPPSGARHVVRLDPGLAFGTGTHPTTRLCLQWIDGHDFAGRSVVDYGCGSGVLGIAAAIKGARQVTCVDNDPQAIIATADNATRNGVASVVRGVSSEAFEAGQADVVLANILAAPLVELAPLLAGLLAPGGSLVLSGILAEQAEDVRSAYGAMGRAAAVTDDNGWIRLVMRPAAKGSAG